MARKELVQLIDDLDDEVIPEGKGETITFGIDGAEYTIDLSDTNAAEFRKGLQPYVEAARTVGGRRGRPKLRAVSGGKGGRDFDIAALRAWAKSNKVDVPARGRIPQTIIDKFKAAMS